MALLNFRLEWPYKYVKFYFLNPTIFCRIYTTSCSPNLPPLALYFFIFEPPVGFGPTTYGLQNRCPACLRLSPRSGLNRQPTVYKTVALPLSYMG